MRSNRLGRVLDDEPADGSADAIIPGERSGSASFSDARAALALSKVGFITIKMIGKIIPTLIAVSPENRHLVRQYDCDISGSTSAHSNL
jgi:hypothetical protein